MRRLTICSCLVLLFAVKLPAQNDEAAIRALVQKYLDTREHGDARTLETLFTASVDQLVSSGEWRSGRDAVVRGTLGSSKATGGQRSITIEKIRNIAPNVVLADGRYELSGLSGGATRKMWSTFILVHEKDGWRIAAIRNMLPAAPAPAK